jgi:hypothetical protein
MKILAWAFALLLMALGGGSWWLYQSRDDLLASAIRSYGPDITGVSVKLAQVHLLPLDGAAQLQGFQLGNPPGFKTPHALVVEQLRIRLEPSSLRQDVVHIHEITIQQPEVGYEHVAGDSNLEAIERHVADYVAAHSPAGSAGTASTQGPKTRVVIDQFNMLGARARVSADLLQGKTVTVVLPDIHLHDLGKRNGGLTPAEATAQIVAAIRQETMRAVLPLHLDGMVGGIKKGASALVDKVKGFFIAPAL